MAFATDAPLDGPGWQRWVYALKPASWPKLLVPTLFGQALGAVTVGTVSLSAVGWGLAFTVCGLGFIVLLNDWGDRRVDTVKRSMFPDGCSPKTIPDGILSSRSVGLVGTLLGLGTLLAAAASGSRLGRPFAFEAGVACMAIFVAYSLPPIRLNYRGGGELLEMLGVGVALPLYNAYLQAGVIEWGLWPWIAGFAALSLGSGVASGLSDEESDRRGGKRTIASVYGNHVARRVTEGCVVVGVLAWMAGAVVEPSVVPIWAAAPAVALIVWRFRSMRRLSTRAVTNAFGEQGEYKRCLHAAIWHGTLLSSVLLVLGKVS